MRYKRVLRRGERLVGSNLKRCYLLALEIHRVHHPLFNFLIRPKSSGPAQELIDQGSLAVVDVRDNGDVADLFHERVPGRGGARNMPVSAGKSTACSIVAALLEQRSLSSSSSNRLVLLSPPIWP